MKTQGKIGLIVVVILMILPHFINAGTSVVPMWLTSKYMRAGNQDVIKVLTGEAIDPIYTFTFSSALPGVPNLAYGIRRYRGADYLGVEQFEIRRLNLTASTFTVQVDIIGTTNLYILNVPYIAVDPTFPHHLNSFDNVPISYGTELVNLTVKTSGTTYFTNIIDYSTQSLGRQYTKFGVPLTGNKMLLYICALHIWASFRTATKMYPLDLSIKYDIESESTYKLSANFSTDAVIQKLHFSQIVYNSDDVESSKKYVIVYQLWKTTNMGGFLPFPQEFIDNFIMGVTDFATIDGKCGFQYQWNFTTINGTFGVEILESIQVSGACGFSAMTSTVFYMKTWQCPQANPYFNLTTNLCQDFCGLYTYENKTIYQCNLCQFACSRCLNASYCLECNSDDNRQIKILRGKRYCDCMDGYYQDPFNSSKVVCLQCIANCKTCLTSTTCELCNQNLGYSLKQDNTCHYCGFGCSSCEESSTCLSCKSTFVLNSTTKKCECPQGTTLMTQTINCVICDSTCLTCGGPTRYQCTSCHQNQNRVSLKQSNGLYQCICNPFNYVQADNGSSICVQRSKQSCDYGFIYIQQKQQCVEICGDGIMFGNFQCDDSNTIDGDGCSKTCKIQQNFTCRVINTTSKCLYTGIVNIINAESFKNPFGNHLLIKCLLSPIQKFFYSLKWKNGLQIYGPNMTVIDGWMEGEWLNVNTSYFEDLTGKTLTIKYQSNGSRLLTDSSENKGRRLFDSVFDFELTLRDYELPIYPTNNIKPIYLRQSEYQKIRLIQQVFVIIAICVMVLVLISLLMKSVFPIWQIILCLQTIFLSLGTLDKIHPMMTGLTEFSVIKGFRSYKIYFESLVSQSIINENNIKVIGYGGSYFGNVNVMIFLIIAFLLGTGAMYLMAKKNLLMQGPFNITKRLLMLVVVFNAMNISLSTCLIQDFYAFQITMASLMIILTAWQIYDLIKNLKKYYYFDNMFDLNNKRIKYFIGGLIVLRIIQAACIAIFRKQILISSIMLVSLQALFTITVSIIRPYTKKTYNILTILGEWSVFAFLSINLCINLQLVNSQQQQYLASIFHISFNSFVILLFVLCIIYALMTDYCSKKVAPIKVILGYEDSFKNINSYDFSKQFDSTNAQSFIQLEENSPIRKASIEEVDWANNKKTKKSNKQTYLGSESPKKRRNNW